MFFLKKLYQKVTPTQVSSCEHCESFKNNFFYRTPVVTASRYKSQYKKWIGITKNKILLWKRLSIFQDMLHSYNFLTSSYALFAYAFSLRLKMHLHKKSCSHLFNLDPLYLGLMTRIDFCVFCARWPNLLS